MILLTEQIDAVIFDLDGTLFDSMGMWKDIDIEFLGRFGYEVPDDLQVNIEGMSFTETATYFLDRFNIPMTLEEIILCWNDMAYDKYAHEILPKKGARRFVQQLKEKGVSIAIASSNSHRLINAVLENNQMKEYFDAVAVSCEVAHGKPAPDVFLLAAEKLNAAPSRCIVFEDIVPGILGGKRAGMRVCAVEDDYSLQNKEEKMQLADDYIVDYDEIELR